MAFPVAAQNAFNKIMRKTMEAAQQAPASGDMSNISQLARPREISLGSLKERAMARANPEEIGGLELLQIARGEIEAAYKTIASMREKCVAYDNLMQLIGLLDRRPQMGGIHDGDGSMSVLGLLDRKIVEIAKATGGEEDTHG